MATSAFKSTSRRSTTASGNSPDKKAPIRRSHSVSAFSRTQHYHDVVSDFSNRRDNPLFWSNASPPDDKEVESCAAAVGTDSAERGRSVVRNSDLGGKKVVVEGGKKKDGVGRSLSRVDTGRRRQRSVSRSHYAAYESEAERDSVVLFNSRSKVSSDVDANRGKKDNLGRNASDMRGRSKERQPLKPKDTSASYLQVPNREDGISAGSLLEAEEKTIKAVCEQMKGEQMEGGGTTANGIYETVRSEVRRAISDMQNDLGDVLQRNNATSIAHTNDANIPPGLVNPGAVELVLDIRREYATKFEESQERATKLRADLAVEEYRCQELSRILKEILPDPKTNNVQKSRPRRKKSNERTKMSKRLTEEAMAFFDECVSISTFDSSDFSAPEDPPLNLVGTATPACGKASLAQGSPSISTGGCLNYMQVLQESGGHVMHSQTDSSLTANSSTDEPMINQASSSGGNDTELGRKSRFSLCRKPTENAGLQLDISNYIKNIEKEYENGGGNSENAKSNYYDGLVHEYTENFLFDRVLLKNQIDSGSLHLCGGGMAVSFSPFGSIH